MIYSNRYTGVVCYGKKRKNLYLIFTSIICLILIILSTLYKLDLRKKEISNNDYDFLKDKTIVRVWLPKDRVSNTREYQAQKFNEKHEDIYIMLSYMIVEIMIIC